MAECKPEPPESGDLLIATVETVTDCGAYAKLDEYNKRAEDSAENYKRADDVLQKASQNVVTAILKPADKSI